MLQRVAGLSTIVLFVVSTALPVDTSFWEVATYEDFLEGTLENISLAREGRLQLSPECKGIFDPDETLVLSLARDEEGQLYLGTGHQGKVYRINSQGEGALLFTAPEPAIFAMVTGPDGALYVGSSPEGKVYRIGPEGDSAVFYDPQSQYIWALAFDAQGSLYVGTGDRGKIYRVNGRKEGELFFDSQQTHVICLLLDSQGNLLVGSEPNGLLYRVSPAGKAFVLYKSDLPEIHSLALDAKGHIYVAALGTAGPKRQPFYVRQSLSVASRATTQGSTTERIPGGGSRQPSPQRSPSTVRSGGLQFPAFSTSIRGKGALYRILADSSVETLWRSNRESIFGLVTLPGRVLFSTSTQGRIFQLTAPAGKAPELTLLNETQEALATRLQRGKGEIVYVATGNIGKIFRLSAAPTSEGTYLSPVRDSQFVSQWGQISWQGSLPAGTEVAFYVRTGNSERPNPTWSDWKGPYRNPEGERLQSPPARYLQWKAVFKGDRSRSPVLDGVTVTFLNQNVAPEIASLKVLTPGERYSSRSNKRSPARGSSSTVRVGSPSSSSSSSGIAGRGAAAKTPITITWKAKDANGDPMVFALFLRAAGEKGWHRLEEEISGTSYRLKPTAVPDGKYTAKVVASDRQTNPVGVVRESERLSAPFWVDNTPPVVKSQWIKGGSSVRFVVEDASSSLRAAEVRIGSRPWEPIASADGIVDSKREIFTVQLPDLPAGEHRIALRVQDRAGNVSLGKILIDISG
jgi:sugar lactone lactonase YvrE